MTTFENPQQAMTYVIARLLEQAARDGVTFSAFEMRLLSGAVSEADIEQFEEQNEEADAEAFWSNVNQLARHALKLDPALRKAMVLSESIPSYLNDGLIAQGLAHTRTVGQKVRRLALLALICVVGGLALAVALMLLAPYFESASGRVTKPVLSLLDRFGLALVAAVLVTGLFWAVRQLRQTN
jgi:hypothetical protein